MLNLNAELPTVLLSPSQANLTSGPELDDRQRSSAKRELHEKGYVEKSSVYDTTVPEKPRLISNDRECEKPHVGSWGGVDRLEMTTCSEGASDVDEVLKGMTHSGGPRREGEGRRGGGGGGRDLGAAYGISADDNELALKEGVEGHQNAAD